MDYNNLSQKVYLFEVTPIKFPLLEAFQYHPNGQKLVFLKWGQTHHKDVMKRFDPTVDDGYPKSEKYYDFEYKCLWSCLLDNKAEATEWEQSWIGPNGMLPESRPEKVWVEKVLGCPDHNYYYDATGITEMRLVTEKQRGFFLKKLYNWKKEYESKKELV